jgi:YtcA family
LITPQLITAQSITPQSITPQLRSCFRIGLFLPLAVCAGCNRAPSFDILGSFFPAWLVCLAIGLILAGVAHWVLACSGMRLALPILAYPGLVALFTFAFWLGFFR